MRTMDTKELNYCIDVLELPRTVKNLLDVHSREELRKGLEQFKAVVRSHRRKLAKKYHPDRTGGDDSRMKAINDAVDFVEGLKVIPAPRQQFIVRYGFNVQETAASSATTSFSATFNDVNFENIKKVFGWEL